MHLLGRVEFRSSGRTLKSWMRTFPEPSKSLAYCMRGLYLSHIEAISVAIADGRPWVHSFNHIAVLRVAAVGVEITTSLLLGYTDYPLSCVHLQ